MTTATTLTNSQWLQSLKIGDRVNVSIFDRNIRKSRSFPVEVIEVKSYKLAIKVSIDRSTLKLEFDRVSGYLSIPSTSPLRGWLTP